MRRHGYIRNERDVEIFIREITLGSKEVRDEVAEDAISFCRVTADEFTRQRLPGGGTGSYSKSMHNKVWKGKTRSTGKLWNNHPWSQAVEWGTKPRVMRGRFNIDKVIPPLGTPPGSRDIHTVPWGTRYTPADIKTDVVMHPGSRAFYIFTDTFRSLVSALDRMIENALNKRIPK